MSDMQAGSSHVQREEEVVVAAIEIEKIEVKVESCDECNKKKKKKKKIVEVGGFMKKKNKDYSFHWISFCSSLLSVISVIEKEEKVVLFSII